MKDSSDGKSFLISLNSYRGINIGKNVHVAKYRFNKSFHLIGAEEFLKDLFNDKTVMGNFAPLRCISEQVNSVKFSQVNCNVLNMSYFDVFQELGLCTDTGQIRQNYEERLDGIVLGDKLRQAMLWEDTEDIDSWDALHAEKY